MASIPSRIIALVVSALVLWPLASFGQRFVPGLPPPKPGDKAAEPVKEPETAPMQEGSLRRNDRNLTAPEAPPEAPPPPQKEPALLIAEAMQGILKGFQLNKLLAGEDRADRVLLFEKGDELSLVLFTERVGEHTVEVALSPGPFAVFRTSGEELGKFVVAEPLMVLPLTREPLIYKPLSPNPMLQVAAALERIPGRREINAPETVELSVTFRNPLPDALILNLEGEKTIAVAPYGVQKITQKKEIGRFTKPVFERVGIPGLYQGVEVIPVNPLFIELVQRLPDVLTVQLFNPDEQPFSCRAELFLLNEAGDDPFVFSLEMAQRERVKTIELPMKTGGDLPYPLQLRLMGRSSLDPGTFFKLAESPQTRTVRVGDFTRVNTDGTPLDHTVLEPENGVALLSVAEPKEGDLPARERASLALVYRFDAKAGGFAAAESAKNSDKSIYLSPKAYGCWVYGDASRNYFAAIVQDRSEKTYYLERVVIDWKGWRFLRLKVPNGLLMPIKWRAIMAVEKSPGGETSGAVFINNPILIYED